MEDKLYTKEEVWNYMGAAVGGYRRGAIEGAITGTVIMLALAGISAGLGIGIQKIRDHVWNKKLAKAADEINEKVAEMEV